jgi:Coenzyme PQQ synthesis protein D (PqqD)
LDDECLTQYSRSLGLEPPRALVALATAIAGNPGWSPETRASLIVRSHGRPEIAVLGLLTSADEDHLEAQTSMLRQTFRRLRYVGFDQIEEDCRHLAARLAETLGPDLRTTRFTAIPRGGWIVLSRVATALGLAPSQITTGELPATEKSGLVVIDDCALSGVRFAQFLSRCPASRIHFAPLYSSPALRQNLRAREPRVASCQSAADVVESPLPEGFAGWPEDPLDPWRDVRYGFGPTEAICFPWNEPNRALWNPQLGRYQTAWRVVPAELCAKNRPDPRFYHPPVQLQPEGRGPLRPSSRVLFGEAGGEVVLCDLDSGDCFQLAGSGSDFWRALVRHETLEAAVDEVARAHAAPRDILRGDLDRFVEILSVRGLLE